MDSIGMGAKMALRRFALRVAGGLRGKRADEDFARALIACFGWVDPKGAPEDTSALAAAEGLLFGHTFSVADQGKRTKRTLTAYWPERRVAVDVVAREMVLDLAHNDLLRGYLQMDQEPQYVVLTNQRDVRLYDLARDRGEPQLSIAVDELPKYSEAFPFFAPDWVPGATPKIVNVDKVSKEVADLVAKVYRALLAKTPKRREDVIRFTLQCIIAMFAEDIGLLPKEYFTTLLYEGAEADDAEERLAALFREMSTEKKGKGAVIPFFNGGLFTHPVTLKLGPAPLRALTKAAESNWTFVDPHIFGSVFQGIMDDAERHASGAHYTAREDIMSVVGPTIVEPWRERVDAASKLAELRDLLEELASYRVLDPACGSGNFLYVAFRELYKLETEVLCRMHDFASVKKGKVATSWASGIRTTNFFGIDINPFAVELAKTTLNIAKKIAFEERKATVVELYGQGFLEVDPSLPLDNLDENVVCKDALFTDWPEVDAIVGNPPFLGAKWMRTQLGARYVRKLKASYPDVGGDLSAYWFRRAHDVLRRGQRAGLISTSGIRVGRARQSALDYIVGNEGTFVDVVSERDWPGDAGVHVSVINWLRGTLNKKAVLEVDGVRYSKQTIAPHLQLHTDVGRVRELSANRGGTSQGLTFGTSLFFVSLAEARHLHEADMLSSASVRPVANGSDLLGGKLKTNPSRAICLLDCESEEKAKEAVSSYKFLRDRVYPFVRGKAEKATTGHYSQWMTKWWKPFWSRDELFRGMALRQRVAMCSRITARWVVSFVSTAVVPVDKLQVFEFDDDYSFGIIQSSLHWAWIGAKGGRRETRRVYNGDAWNTFPWPQAPTEADVASVAAVGRELRATRDRLMAENDWSLRDLYQAAEVAGPHPMKDAQAALDEAVEQAFGKPADQEATDFLLELNLCLAEDEAAGDTIQGPGLPEGLAPEDPRWFSTDCIEPPPLEEVLARSKGDG